MNILLKLSCAKNSQQWFRAEIKQYGSSQEKIDKHEFCKKAATSKNLAKCYDLTNIFLPSLKVLLLINVETFVGYKFINF